MGFGNPIYKALLQVRLISIFTPNMSIMILSLSTLRLLKISDCRILSGKAIVNQLIPPNGLFLNDRSLKNKRILARLIMSLLVRKHSKSSAGLIVLSLSLSIEINRQISKCLRGILISK